MLKYSSTRDALEALLEGDKLLPAELEDFIQSLNEDQYLDYKDGVITTKQKRNRGAAIIREYVSAFANSEGGILVIGVADQPRGISACTPGKEPLDKWVDNLLSDMYPRLSPPPRIQVITHQKGLVLVIAVARAPELVPCIEARSASYFLRAHHRTFKAPAYLISDLVLGRRQHPIVEMSISSGELFGYLGTPNFRPKLFFSAENMGFVTAEQLELGFITWSIGEYGGRLNSSILSYIDLEIAPDVAGLKWKVQHEVTRARSPEITRLTPFGRVGFEPMENFLFPFLEKPVKFFAAMYFLSRGAPPIWFQVEFICKLPEVSGNSPPVIREFQVTKLSGRRPRVACISLD